MSGRPSPHAIRALAAAHGVTGAVLVARPQATDHVTHGATTPRWVIRMLGARLAMQAGTELIWPTRAVALAGSAVDATHLASMLAVALGSARHRRAALVSAAAAGLSAAALVAIAGRR